MLAEQVVEHVAPVAEHVEDDAAAFGLALLLLLPGIGAGYSGRDEAEYAGVAHAMNAAGDYLVPRLFGRLYPDKPPLSEWLTAASFRALGESEASGRLPHVLLAAGSAALLLRLGARLLERQLQIEDLAGMDDALQDEIDQAFRDYQRNVSELSQLSDRELADIGLDRSDIPRVAAGTYNG